LYVTFLWEFVSILNRRLESVINKKTKQNKTKKTIWTLLQQT